MDMSNFQKTIDKINKQYKTDFRFVEGSNTTVADNKLNKQTSAKELVNQAKQGEIQISKMEESENRKLSQNEQAVVDNIVENRKQQLKEQNGKVTKKEISKIEQEVKQDLQRGYIDTNDIERTLSNEAWTRNNEVVTQKENLEKQLKELQSKKMSDMTVEEYNSTNNKIRNLQQQIDNIDTDITRSELNSSMNGKITDNDTLLQKVYGEELEKQNDYKFDENEEQTKFNKTINDDIKNLKLNNHIKTRDTVDLLKKLSNETGQQYRLIDNNDSRVNKFEGKTINGFVENGEVFVNIDSDNLINRILGHETTHLFEGTEEHSKLRDIAKTYAETKGEYESRRKALQETYKDVKDADIENELTADIVGDYIFSDIDFVRNLSTEQPNMFQKIYNRVKHLYNMATAGSKEARQLEQLKYNFEKVYRENNQSKASNDTKFSIQTDNKGNKYVNVDTDQDIFDGIDKKDYNKIAKMYINDYLKGKTILSESDTAIIDSKTAKKYTNPGKKQPNFSEKMRLTPELKNVLEISEKVGESSESKDNSKYKNWEYYRTIFKINNEMFEGLVNIGIDSKGNKHLYEVNNIKKTSGISETSPNRPTGFSRNNIPQNEQKVNSDIPTKYSIQNKENNAQELLSSSFSNETKYSKNTEGINDYLNKNLSTKDNSGRKLSKKQQEYFKDSKARDDNGNLITVYHTTTNEGTQINEFNPVGTEHYRFGDQVVNYYTDSKDMSGSYAGQDYIMADTKKITSMKEVEDYIKTMNILGWGSQYTYELVNEDGKYKLVDNSKLPNSDKTKKQIYDEANEYKKSLTEKELKQFKDMFEYSSEFQSDGRYNIDSYLMRKGFWFRRR